MPTYAKLRSDLVSSSAVVDGVTVNNIKDPVTGNYFRLREPEFWLIQQLDGRTSYEEIAERFREKFNLSLTADAVIQFVDRLEKLFFLENTRAEQELSRKSYSAGKGQSLFSRLLFVKIKGFKPGRFLDGLAAVYRPFHNRFWFAVELLVVVFGFGLLVANSRYFYIDLVEIFNIGSLLAVVLSIFIIVTLHEFAHVVVCRYYGGEVREMGFLLLYFQPCFYSDLSDAWLFKKKSHRLAVTWAGPYFQFVLMALAVFVWRVTIVGTFVNDVARIVAVVCWITVLFNFNPLIKLDGYYLLSDWVDIPNLRRKSFAYLGNLLKRKLLGWPIEPYLATKREKKIFLTYAILAVAYSAFLISYVLVIVARFLVAKAGGWGLLLLFAVLFFTLKPTLAGVMRGLVQHLSYMKRFAKNPRRLAVHVLIVVAAIVLVFAVPFPHRVSGEVTVRPIEEFTLLLNEFGLLERNYRRGGANPENKSSYLQMTSTEMAVLDLVPLARDGQKVQPGDTLAVLISNQVIKEIIANTALLEKFEGELALLKAPPKKEEIAEAEAQVAAAQASYDQLVREMNRSEELVEKNLASREELEAARSAVQIAGAELTNKKSRLELLKAPPKPEEEAVLQAEIEKQRAKVDFLKVQQDAQSITSPIEGTVTADHSDDRVLSVVDSRQIELLAPVSDFDINLVKTGQAVKLKVRSYPERTFIGRVVHIPRGAHSSGGSSRFLVSVVVDNDDELLCKGMTGYAKIEVGRSSLFGLVVRKLASIVRVEFWSWW
ncbi:MAG: HlyD family efflux transporter periplasmic adaptor subunit [Candidatus Zixiibacteriota bacterium]|nr:MAG: HlyD family efflux transporter periplasmic adaptor subunit [candidate division Zixibacteria bacterium]